MRRVGSVLAECVALTALDLSDNALEDTGAENLAMCLPQCAELERLCLRENEIGGMGAAALAGALAGMGGLKELDVGGNKLKAAGAGLLSIGLCESATLRRSVNAPPRTAGRILQGMHALTGSMLGTGLISRATVSGPVAQVCHYFC